MKIGNPTDSRGRPLITEVKTEGLISGNGTEESPLKFDGIPVTDSSGHSVNPGAKSLQAGNGVAFTYVQGGVKVGIVGSVADEAVSSHDSSHEAHADLFNGKQDRIDKNNKLGAEMIDGLAMVAKTGSYYDLKDRPSIPDAASNAKITIAQNGVSKGDFTLNQSTTSTIELDGPVQVDWNLTSGVASILHKPDVVLKDGFDDHVKDDERHVKRVERDAWNAKASYPSGGMKGQVLTKGDNESVEWSDVNVTDLKGMVKSVNGKSPQEGNVTLTVSDIDSGIAMKTDISSHDSSSAAHQRQFDAKQDKITSANMLSHTLVSGLVNANNATVTIKQGGVSKGSFTLNQLDPVVIELDAGGTGGGSGGGAGGGGFEQVQADWSETSKTSKAFIRNKPVNVVTANDPSKIWRGDRASYEKIPQKDPGVIYFVEDEPGSSPGSLEEVNAMLAEHEHRISGLESELTGVSGVISSIEGMI